MNPLIRRVLIVNPLGLHARAAARLAAIAAKATGQVWLRGADERVDATSIIDILTLACPMGSLVTVEIQDPEDSPILDRIVQLVAEGFGE
jgi:phosphocarrier protein